MYDVLFSRPSLKYLKTIPSKDRLKILAKIDLLLENPYREGSVKLKGVLFPSFRYRCGNYRILYQVIDGRLIVSIVEINHRKDVYKK